MGALEDTWTLSIQAHDLSDLLRGRRELAHAVLRGFYDTFRRRLTQVVERGGSVKREWILAIDVNKSPSVHGKGIGAAFQQQQEQRLAGTRFEVPAGEFPVR